MSQSRRHGWSLPASEREVIRKRIAEDWIFPISRRQHVYVAAFDGNGQRFADLFAKTWKALPLSARRRILGHWHRPHPFVPATRLPMSPTIQLTASWSGRDLGDHPLAGTWAAVSNNGHHMHFFSRIVEELPDSHVCELVAHELAHVVQHAWLWRRDYDKDGNPIDVDQQGNVMTALEIEDDADELMADWGFEPEAMVGWAIEQGIVRKKEKEVSLSEFIDEQIRFDKTGRR